MSEAQNTQSTGAPRPVSLRDALRKARIEAADRTGVVVDLRDAEVARLEQLGAQRVAFVRERWWVMEAPSGHRFCVVRPQREVFGRHLNRWE